MIPQLDKEKAVLGDLAEELSEALVMKRKEGLERARQMERDRTLHSLHVLIDRSKRLKQEVKRYKNTSVNSSTPPLQPQPNYTEAHEKLLQDLEKAITQAHEYKKLTLMKVHMTPRPPIISRRNISDSQTLNGFSVPSENQLFTTPDHIHVPSDNIPTGGHQMATSSEKLNEYLLEVQLPTIAQTIEATSEELNFAAEMQKVSTEQRHSCDDETQDPLLEETLGDGEDPELLKLVSAVKNLPKDTRS